MQEEDGGDERGVEKKKGRGRERWRRIKGVARCVGTVNVLLYITACVYKTYEYDQPKETRRTPSDLEGALGDPFH